MYTREYGHRLSDAQYETPLILNTPLAAMLAVSLHAGYEATISSAWHYHEQRTSYHEAWFIYHHFTSRACWDDMAYAEREYGWLRAEESRRVTWSTITRARAPSLTRGLIIDMRKGLYNFSYAKCQHVYNTPVIELWGLHTPRMLLTLKEAYSTSHVSLFDICWGLYRCAAMRYAWFSLQRMTLHDALSFSETRDVLSLYFHTAGPLGVDGMLILIEKQTFFSHC